MNKRRDDINTLNKKNYLHSTSYIIPNKGYIQVHPLIFKLSVICEQPILR